MQSIGGGGNNEKRQLGIGAFDVKASYLSQYQLLFFPISPIKICGKYNENRTTLTFL